MITSYVRIYVCILHVTCSYSFYGLKYVFIVSYLFKRMGITVLENLGIVKELIELDSHI